MTNERRSGAYQDKKAHLLRPSKGNLQVSELPLAACPSWKLGWLEQEVLLKLLAQLCKLLAQFPACRLGQDLKTPGACWNPLTLVLCLPRPRPLLRAEVQQGKGRLVRAG